jgi:hypothetical protein
VTISTSSQDIEFLELGNGRYEVKFKGATKWFEGYENISITISKDNFNFKVFYWAINITVPIIKFITALSSTQIDYSGEWGNSFNITLKYVDPIHNIWINGTHPVYSHPYINIIPGEVNNGSHTLQITPKTVGTWQISFNLTPGLLNEYYEVANIIITINGLQRSTAETFELSSNTIEVFYQRSVSLDVKWKDSILANHYANLSQNPIFNDINWAEYVLFEPSTNTIRFTIYGYQIDGFILQITFNSSFYIQKTLSIEIVVNELETLAIGFNDVVYYSGIVSGEVNTSKLGYTLGGTIKWYVADNQSLISIPQIGIIVDINGSVVQNLEPRGITIYDPTLSSEWSLNFNIVFDPQYGYQRGTYIVRIAFNEAGFESQSIELVLIVKGFDIQIDISYEDTFIQGDDFPISVILTYVNKTDTPLNSTFAISDYIFSIHSHIKSDKYRLSDYLMFDQNIGIGKAVQGNLVTFELEVTFQNGTIKKMQYQDLTDNDGKVEYIIPAEQTVNIIQFNSIGISLSNQDYSSLGKFTIEIGNKILVKLRENQDYIIFILTFLIIILLSIVLALFVYKRRRKEKKTEEVVEKPLTTPIIESITTIEKIQPEISTEKEEPEVKDKEEEILASEFEDKPKKVEIVEKAIDDRFKLLYENIAIEMREFTEEITYILKLVMARTGKNKGKMTLNFLKKTLPERFSREKMEIVFNDLPEKTQLFRKKGISLVITQIGKKISSEFK